MTRELIYRSTSEERSANAKARLESLGILSHREIAIRLGISHTEVRRIEKRAIRKMQTMARMTNDDLLELLRQLEKHG